MRVTESGIERRACMKIRVRLNIENIKLNINANTGYPDRMFLIPGGKPVFIEFKKPGGVLSKKQQYTISLLQRLGYNVLVTDTIDEAFHYIESLV